MTVAQWTPDICPKCLAENGAELDAHTRLCLSCRYEWDPTTTTGPLVSPLSAVPDPVVPLVLGESQTADAAPAAELWNRNPVAGQIYVGGGIEALAAQLHEARSRLLGATVMVHEVDAEGTVSEIDADGYAIVGFGSGYSIRCAPDEFTVTDATVIEDETIAALATTYTTIAAQVLRAGAETIDTSSEPRRLSVPPDGWLPEDPDVMPVIEAGAAYAIATLAIMAGISTDDLSALADGLDSAAGAVEGANGQ